MTTAAVVNTCLDQRLEHGPVRLQIRSRLEQLGIHADSIYFTNGAGGNIDAGLRGAVDRLLTEGEEIVFAAVLHHDDCLAARQGMRHPLSMSATEVTAYLVQHGVRCPVQTGSLSVSNSVTWEDASDVGTSVKAQVPVTSLSALASFVVRPIGALAVGVLTVSALAAFVVALISSGGAEEQASTQTTTPSTAGPAIVGPPASSVRSPVPGVTRDTDGRVLVTDSSADCLSEESTPVACATVIDLSSVEVWTQNGSLFIVVTTNQGDFQRLDSYTLSFAFDLDRNPETRLSRTFEPNGLGHELEIRLEKEQVQMSIRVIVKSGFAVPAVRRAVEQNRIELELSRFPAGEFEMLVRLEADDDVRDFIPDGGKLSFPDGRFIQK